MDRKSVSAALGLTATEASPARRSNLVFWLFLALTLSALAVLLVSRTTSAFALISGNATEVEAQHEDDIDGAGGDDDDDESDVSEGITAGDVSADTAATGVSAASEVSAVSEASAVSEVSAVSEASAVSEVSAVSEASAPSAPSADSATGASAASEVSAPTGDTGASN